MIGNGWQQKFWSCGICSQEVESEQEVEVKISRPSPWWPTSFSQVLLPEGSATFPNSVIIWGPVVFNCLSHWGHSSHASHSGWLLAPRIPHLCLSSSVLLAVFLPAFCFSESYNNIGHYVLCWSSPVALQLFDLIPSTKTPFLFFPKKALFASDGWVFGRGCNSLVVLCRSYTVQDPSPQNCAGHSHLVC